MLLRELEIGDIFFAESDRLQMVKYTVRNNCVFNRGHGTSTRYCYLPDGTIVNKSGKLKVIKAGESKHKEKLQQLYGKPNTQPV